MYQGVVALGTACIADGMMEVSMMCIILHFELNINS